MTSWDRNIVENFTIGLSYLWIAHDPDGILLDKDLQNVIQSSGFTILEYEDSISFRAKYENLLRNNVDENATGFKKSAILRYSGNEIDQIPYDYLRKGTIVNLHLAQIIPNLDYNIVKHLNSEHYRALYPSYCDSCTRLHGKEDTIDFVLRKLFNTDIRSLGDASRFWQNILQVYVSRLVFPRFFLCYIEELLSKSYSGSLSIRNMLSSRDYLLCVLQSEWEQYISSFLIQDRSNVAIHGGRYKIPFHSPEIRGIVCEMFLTGDLRRVRSREYPSGLPIWARLGVELSSRSSVDTFTQDISLARQSMPRDNDASNKDWIKFAFRLGHIKFRYYKEKFHRDSNISSHIDSLQEEADSNFKLWLKSHFSNLSTMSISNGPVMVHHIPRYLSFRHNLGEQKICLIVVDGMSIDQWIQIWEILVKQMPNLVKQEFGCFAWPPTITSVSRQAIFSGLKPIDFSNTIYKTSAEALLWTKFWEENGILKTEVSLENGINRYTNLHSLEKTITRSNIKIIAVVINMIDDLSHSNRLGKQDVSRQISVWCDRENIIQRICLMLMENDFSIYVTSDHGNVEAVGIGTLNQGTIADIRGQRVRVYDNKALASVIPEDVDIFQFEVDGLPSNFFPYYAGGRGAFTQAGKKVVSHGGISLGEMIVSFARISTSEHP